RDVFLSFHSLLTDLLFVAGLEYLAAAWVAPVEQLCKEVTIPVPVEDKFTLCRCGVGFCLLDFEKSGGRPIRAADFHNGQVGVVEHVDAVIACGKFRVACMEREWDVDFKVP